MPYSRRRNREMVTEISRKLNSVDRALEKSKSTLYPYQSRVRDQKQEGIRLAQQGCRLQGRPSSSVPAKRKNEYREIQSRLMTHTQSTRNRYQEKQTEIQERKDNKQLETDWKQRFSATHTKNIQNQTRSHAIESALGVTKSRPSIGNTQSSLKWDQNTKSMMNSQGSRYQESLHDKLTRLLDSKPKNQTQTKYAAAQSEKPRVDQNMKQKYLNRQKHSQNDLKNIQSSTKPQKEASSEVWKDDLRRGMVKAVDIWQSLLKTKDLPKIDAKRQRKNIFLEQSFNLSTKPNAANGGRKVKRGTMKDRMDQIARSGAKIGCPGSSFKPNTDRVAQQSELLPHPVPSTQQLLTENCDAESSHQTDTEEQPVSHKQYTPMSKRYTMEQQIIKLRQLGI